MSRVILHVDMNSFYASVEQTYDPSLRGKAVAVAGSVEERHGIILAKSTEAKAMGVQTGEAIWQAKQKCPSLLLVDAHYDRYLHYSALAQHLYLQYTDCVEPYGMDECWMDVTGSCGLFGSGEDIARDIRRKIRTRLGVTVSVGISDNKIFAKLGSDYRKPDAQTRMDPSNMKEIVWPLPVSDLLFVGSKTTTKLLRFGITTIGELANSDPTLIRHRFGINGLRLWTAANGQDATPVASASFRMPPKSIGCGTTFVRDLYTERDIQVALLRLAEELEERLITAGFSATRLGISLRDQNLRYRNDHTPLRYPSWNASSLAEAAFPVALSCRDPNVPIRAITLTAQHLLPASRAVQTVFFADIQENDRKQRISRTMHELRERFGHKAARLATLDSFELADLDTPRAKMPRNLFSALRKSAPVPGLRDHAEEEPKLRQWSDSA